MNNYAVLHSILSGLCSIPIKRLSHTWINVPLKIHKIFAKLADTISYEQDSANYRSALETASFPCIPQLSYHFEKLKNLHHEPIILANGMVSVTKIMALSTVINDILRFQKSSFVFESVSDLQRYLSQSFKNHNHLNNDDLLKMSIQLERENIKTIESDKIGKLLQLSGML